MVLPKTDEFASRFPDEIRTLLATLRMGNLGSLAVAECDDLALQARIAHVVLLLLLLTLAGAARSA